MFKFGGEFEVLFGNTFENEMNAYCEKFGLDTAYIRIDNEPWKTISKETEKMFDKNTILFRGWYFVKEGKEYLFDKKTLETVQETFISILTNTLPEYDGIDLISKMLVIDDDDFRKLETLSDIENLYDKYVDFIRNNYDSLQQKLGEIMICLAEKTPLEDIYIKIPAKKMTQALSRCLSL